MIKPYDLGNKLVENTQRLSIDDFLRKANIEFKKSFVNSQIVLLGYNLQLGYTKTKFNGSRLSFICPICKKKKRVLFTNNFLIGCRECLNLSYKDQRYKGMVEIM